MTERAEHTLRMLSRVGRLEVLPRTGWLFSGVVQPESIAAHAYEVVVLSLWLADAVEEDVDIATVARIAAAHDAAESLLTDLPKPVKNLIGKGPVAAAERDATAAVFEGGSAEWLGAYAAYENVASIEARIVKAADTIQMLVKALQYEAQGRGDVRRFFRPERSDFGFPIVREILDAIVEHRENGTWHMSDVD